MSGIRLERVNKVYHGRKQVHHAVRDLDLEVYEGELLVLVGPSGCGKTTTLRMVAGLETMSTGSIFIGDRRVDDLDPGERDIAMVFQDYALYPHLTVYENMAFALQNRRVPKNEIDASVFKVAELMGLQDLLRRKPKQLSGGQRQRVAVGRAMVRSPKAFLFDEPLSNLDAQLRAQVRVELADLHRRLGSTMLYVTHDQVEAMTLGDRIVVMKDGVIQQIDTPSNLYRYPANDFIARFIGTPPMNIINDFIPNQWLGIRPEDIRIVDSQSGQARMVVYVYVVEHLGSEILIHTRRELTSKLNTIVVKISSDSPRPVPGEKIGITFADAAVSWFDPQSGIRLSKEVASAMLT
jgi:multiple sugar transport system ATP-binding protein